MTSDRQRRILTIASRISTSRPLVANMSLTYGFGGATATLAVIGACELSRSSKVNRGDFDFNRYALHRRWRSFQRTSNVGRLGGDGD